MTNSTYTYTQNNAPRTENAEKTRAHLRARNCAIPRTTKNPWIPLHKQQKGGTQHFFSNFRTRSSAREEAERTISCSFSRSSDSRKQKIASCSYVRERINMSFSLI